MQPLVPSYPIPDLPLQLYDRYGRGASWIQQNQNHPGKLICALGFTATGLIPDISAAGKTPKDRRYTALADAEFLANGMGDRLPYYHLPPLHHGLSPALITRCLYERLGWPMMLFNAGLPEAPSVPSIDIQGVPAQCVSTGKAMPRHHVRRILNQGMHWGEKLSFQPHEGYLIIGECVVGGTTTALGVLTGLGFEALGRISSSHLTCNHDQKQAIVQEGLQRAKLPACPDPLDLLAAVGDPMQVLVAGMTLTASRQIGILLAGGTQMLAVYALTAHIAQYYGLPWQPQQVLVGTTRWVVEDPTADVQGLINHMGEKLGPDLAPSLAVSQFHLRDAPSSGFHAYERGYVKEGMAAGGMMVAASVSAGWTQEDFAQVIYPFGEAYEAWRESLSG